MIFNDRFSYSFFSFHSISFLRESDADRSLRALSEDIVDKVISSAEREISSKDGNSRETENEENCIKSSESNPGPPRMESVAVGYGHYDGSSFDSGSENESSSEVNDENYKDRATIMKGSLDEKNDEKNDEKHDLEHKNASGDAPPVPAGMDVQNWALYISNQIMTTFTEQKNVFSAADLTSICHVSQLSPYKVVDTLLPVLKNKIDAMALDKTEKSSVRRDSIASTASSDMAIQTEAQKPEKMDTKIDTKIQENKTDSTVIISKTDSGVQCDIEKSPVLKLTSENSKLAKKLDNLQNDHSSVVKKLDSSKKLVDEEKEKFKSFKKSANEEKRLIEQEKSTLKKVKSDADNKLKCLEQKNKSLESDVKNVEIKFTDEKKKLKKKLEQQVVEGKHKFQDLQKKLELREQDFSQKLDLMDAKMKEMEKRSRNGKFLFSFLMLFCFVLALPFLDIFICCDNPIDYARQLLSWIDQSRFERLSNGEC